MSLRSKLRLIKCILVHHWLGLKHVHKTSYICMSAKIAKDFRAGACTYVGPHCEIYPGAKIGDYTMLAKEVCILGGDHRFDIPERPIVFSGRAEQKHTVIERDCWIGTRAIIMCGVTIGEGSIIAAGAVVTKDVSPYSVYGGVPAQKIKARFNNESEEERHHKALHSTQYTIFQKKYALCERLKPMEMLSTNDQVAEKCNKTLTGGVKRPDAKSGVFVANRQLYEGRAVA